MEGRSPTDHPLRWFAVLLAASFVVAIPAMNAPYFCDDFQFVFDASVINPLHHFTWQNPENAFYRPIQSATLAAVQAVAGTNTWPIHVVQILLHAALAMLVFTALSGLGFKRRDAGLASLLVAVSQAAVMAVSSNDTLSQVLGVLAGYLSMWAFYRSARAHRGDSLVGDRHYLAGLAWLAVALFSKETSVAFIPLGALTLLAGIRAAGGAARRVGVFALRLAPLAVVLAVYGVARFAVLGVAAEGGSGRYGIALGANVVENLAMLWTAATIPFSSVSLFTAISSRDLPALGAFGVVYAALAVVVAFGLWRRRRDPRVGWLVAAALLSVSSIIPIARVSELYAYQLLPVAAALIALGLGAVGRAAARRQPWRTVWIAMAVGLIAGNGVAAHSKARMIDENARRASVLLDAVVPHAAGLAPGGELVLQNPGDTAVEYSMFRISGFNLLRHAEFYVARRAGRDDITVTIARDAEPAPGRVVLVLDGDTVRMQGSDGR